MADRERDPYGNGFPGCLLVSGHLIIYCVKEMVLSLLERIGL